MRKTSVLRSALILSLGVTSLGALSACGQLNPFSSSSSPSQQASNTAPNTAVPGQRTGNDGFVTPPVVAPPSYGDRPLEPGQSEPAARLPNGLPALKPLKGVNVNTLFSENISNTGRRFDRLENAVIDMRREFEAVKPAIVRLVAVEEDIQNMVEQLESMAVSPSPSASAPSIAQNSATQQNLQPVDLAPAPQVSAPQVNAQPAAAPKASAPIQSTSGAPIVRNLRTGAYSNKTRLVLDMSAKTPYTIDLDNTENILVIELPQAGWAGSRSKSFSAKEKLLASYNVETINNGKGSRIIVPLKKSSQVLKSALLPPGVTPNYRMYIDLSL